MRVTHLVVGPARHGVTAFAADLAESIRRREGAIDSVAVEHWRDLDSSTEKIPRGNGVHLNVTDRLFGATPSDAAARVVALIRHVERTGARVTVTLHDVPQPADGGNYQDRAAAFREICAAAHGLVTNSDHERLLLGESLIARPEDVEVIALPLDLVGTALNFVGTASRRPSVERRDVGVFGFLYPGKGHDEVLAAMTGLPQSVGFLAVGEPSAGHDDVVEGLAATARRDGRRFSLTGYVPDDAIHGILGEVAVPVAHHRHVSASGSINTWIAAHRRPLVPVNRYTTEHAERHPGTVTQYPDTPRGLREAIDHALENPDSTWVAPGTVSGSPSEATAAQYVHTLARWHD